MWKFTFHFFFEWPLPNSFLLNIQILNKFITLEFAKIVNQKYSSWSSINLICYLPKSAYSFSLTYIPLFHSIDASIDHLIFAWLLIRKKNDTYVMPFGSLLKRIQRIFKILLYSSSSAFLMVLNPPSGVENSKLKNPPLSCIKSCFLTLRIWASFVAPPEQNLA